MAHQSRRGKNTTFFRNWLERHNVYLGHNIKAAEQAFQKEKKLRESKPADKKDEKRVWVQVVLPDILGSKETITHIVAEGQKKRSQPKKRAEWAGMRDGKPAGSQGYSV